MKNNKPEKQKYMCPLTEYNKGLVDGGNTVVGTHERYLEELLKELKHDYLFRKENLQMSISSRIQSLAKELGWDNEQ